MTRTSLALLASLALCFTACHDHDHDHDHSGDGAIHDHKPGHDHDHGEKGPNGGMLLELAGSGHLEVHHDEEAGKISMWLTGEDAKTAAKPDAAPVVTLQTEDGEDITLTCEEEGGAWVTSHEALKHHPDGRIRVSLGGKNHQKDLHDAHDHGHDHDHDH